MTKRYTRAVLVAGGPLPPAQATLLQTRLAHLDAQTALVGVDGGATHLWELGIIPHFVTGDFDSLLPEQQAALATRGARIIPTPDQNHTDLDKALTFAKTLGEIKEVEIWAATGGRIDHAYSVLSTLLKHGRGANTPHLVLRDEWGETRPVPQNRVTLENQIKGRVLSLITLGTVSGITTTGVEWPLTNETLAPGVRDGTLNRITDGTVTISYQSGDLLLFIGD